MITGAPNNVNDEPLAVVRSKAVWSRFVSWEKHLHGVGKKW